MFRVTRYPMISKTESDRVGYRKKYRVAGRVGVPAGHWLEFDSFPFVCLFDEICKAEYDGFPFLYF